MRVFHDRSPPTNIDHLGLETCLRAVHLAPESGAKRTTHGPVKKAHRAAVRNNSSESEERFLIRKACLSPLGNCADRMSDPVYPAVVIAKLGDCFVGRVDDKADEL